MSQIASGQLQLETMNEESDPDFEAYLREQESITNYLASFGLIRQQTGGDGNCLFRSISRQLYQHEDMHLWLRQLVMRTIRQNFAYYANFFIGDDLTLENLGNDGIYAGQESILALSEALNINIMVTLVNNDDVVTIENKHPSNVNPRHVHISYSQWGGGHYESVIEGQIMKSVGKAKNIPTGGICKRKWDFDKVTIIDLTKDDISNYKVTLNSVSPQEVSTEHSYVQSGVPAVEAVQNVQTSQNVVSSSHKVMCEMCCVPFRGTYELNRHNKAYHGATPKFPENLKQCKAQGCGLNFFSESLMLKHLKEDHGVQLKEENRMFNSSLDFNEFVIGEENRFHVNYIRKRAPKTSQSSASSFMLYCNRSGCERIIPRTSSSSKKMNNKKGSCKTGRLCPSRMSVRISADDKVTVKYISTHNHKVTFDQAQFMRLPEKIKDEINMKLAMKVSVKDIFNDIRSIFNDRDTREEIPKEDLYSYHFLERKTIMDMKRKRDLAEKNRHKDNATSVMYMVEAMRREKYDPVLAYKPCGVLDADFPQLEKDDFFLGIMTKTQMEMYKKMGSTILCIDSTHNTNQYKFKLVTVMVPDEVRRGYPVGYCIASHERRTAVQLFLEKLKERAPNTEIKVLMSDDDCVAGIAARNVFGHHLLHFLCTWHVLRSWKKRLPRSEQGDEMYQKLSSMIYTKREEVYLQLKDDFISTFKRTQPEYVKYFRENYESRAEKWAHCYRKVDYANVDTNMFVESFHKILKHVEFEGKQNKRVDALLDAVLLIERNMFVQHYKLMTFGTGLVKQVSGPHHDGTNIDSNHVIRVSDNKYKVKSSTGDSIYQIERLKQECDVETCMIKCMEFPCVDLCIHLYKCSCPSFSSGRVICKHIHKVHGQFVPITPVHNENDNGTDDVQLLIGMDLDWTTNEGSSSADDGAPAPVQTASEKQKGKEDKQKKDMEKLLLQITEKQHSTPMNSNNYEYCMGHLKVVDSYMGTIKRTGKQLAKVVPPMKKKLPVAPTQKSVLQLRFPMPKKQKKKKQ